MQKWNILQRNCAAILCVLMALCTIFIRPSHAQTVVYNWNAQKLYDDTHPATGTNPFNWDTEWVARPDNTQSLKVTVPSTKNADGWYEFINTNFTTLQSQQEYKAIIKFQVATSTKYPRFFYIYARNSNGDAYDIWRKIVDDPGTTRTVEMSMDLKRITPGDYWYLRVGMKGPGSIIIDSFQIVSGAGNTTYPAPPASAGGSQLNDATGIPIATGATPVSIANPATTGPVITASNLIADGVADATANFTALKNYISQCKSSGASKLQIPTGVYRINATSDIDMLDMHDLVIDGQGSELIFEGWRYSGNHFSLNRCSKIVFRNLKIDWNADKKPIASLAQVQSYSETTETNGVISKTIGLTFPDLTAAQTLKLTNDTSIRWLYMHPFDSMRLVTTSAVKNPIPNKYPVAIGSDSLYPTLAFSNIVGNSFTVKMTPKVGVPFKLALEVGKHYVIRHMYYDMIGFKIHNTDNLLFDGVSIYQLPGMGWLLNTKTHHVKLFNCKIERRTGARNPFTTAADGFHINESQGNIELNTCSFTGSGDDSVNIHVNCWQGTFDFGTSTSSTLKFLNLNNLKLRIEPGDVLEFSKADYSPFDPPIQLTVQSITIVGNDAQITFTQPWPNIPNWSIVRNLSYNNSNVRIAGCNFTYTSGRAILLGADNASITNCYFRNVFSTPIQFQTEIVDDKWAEGHGTNNVLIKSNTFENCNQHGRWDGAIIYVGAVLPWGNTSQPLFNTLLVDSNRFFNCPGPAMSFTASKNVVARNNTIEFSQNITNYTRYSSSIFTSNSSNLALGGNKWLYSANATYGNPAVVTGSNVTNVRPNSLPLNSNLLVPFGS